MHELLRTADLTGFGSSVDNLSVRQRQCDADATVIRQLRITEVIAVASSESSTRKIDTECEQDGHVKATFISICPCQPDDQKEGKGSMDYQHNTHSEAFVNYWHDHHRGHGQVQL